MKNFESSNSFESLLNLESLNIPLCKLEQYSWFELEVSKGVCVSVSGVIYSDVGFVSVLLGIITRYA